MTSNPSPVRTELRAKRIRTHLGGQLIANAFATLMVWEIP